MERPDESCFRNWDEQLDNAWFHDGCRPTPIALSHVRSLTVDYASRLRKGVFPTNNEVLVVVAKKRACWLNDVFQTEPFRYGGWPNPTLNEHLRKDFTWAEDELVLFLNRLGKGYQTPWRMFVENWGVFLGWNDEGLLFHPTAREIAAFWDGVMLVGRRSKRRLTTRTS